MSALSKRSTIYFEPDLHRALRLKAASTSRSVSEIVNEALRQTLREFQEDLEAREKGVHLPILASDRSARYRGFVASAAGVPELGGSSPVGVRRERGPRRTGLAGPLSRNRSQACTEYNVNAAPCVG